MSATNSNDAIFGSVFIRDGLVLDNYTREIPGTIRFNSTNKTFEGYTGEDGPLGETWRELTLDIASGTKLGGIKVGTNLFINENGVLSAVATGASRIYQNVITVSNLLPEPGSTFVAGDFQSINAATNYINDLISQADYKAPTAETPIKIIVSPGVYEEIVVLPDYVSLEGEGTGNTIIRALSGTSTFAPNDNNTHIITLGMGSHLENIEIQHYEDGANYSVPVVAFAKQDIVIQNVKITIGTDTATAGIDVIGAYFLNCERVLIDKLDINITQGSGTVHGLYFDMTHNSIIKNTNITINAASDFTYGIYNLNDSDNDFYNVNVDVNTSVHNIAVQHINSASKFHSSKLIAKCETDGTAVAYGLKTDVTPGNEFYVNISSNQISLENNSATPNMPDTITLPDTSPFKNNSYIAIGGSSYDQNNHTFLIKNITPTQLYLNSNVLISEPSSPFRTINIAQYYTIHLNYSIIDATTSSIMNITQDSGYAFKDNKSVFLSSVYGPVLNNSILKTSDYKTITVSRENGDFPSLSQAINSINDNSEYNPYVILVKPGIYNEKQTFITLSYVDIIGSDRDSTIINCDISTSSIDASSLISLRTKARISNLTIKNTNQGGVESAYRCAIYGEYISDCILDNVNIIVNSQDTNSIGLYLKSVSIKLLNTNITVSGNDSGMATGTNTGLYVRENNDKLVSLHNCDVNVSDSLNQNLGVYSKESNINISSSTINVNNTNNGNNNYALQTFSTTLDQYLIQLVSSQLTINKNTYDEANNYAINVCDNQTVVGIGCNLIGRLYYNNTPGSNSHLKLQSCYRVENIGGVITYVAINEGGIPMSSENGNLIIGENAGNLGMTGAFNNTIVGNEAGSSIISGDNSAFFGYEAGHSLTDGNNNTFLGQKAGRETTTGDSNTFTGNQSGQNNQTGGDNSAYGAQSFFSNLTGERNTILGREAGYNLNSDDNVAIGYKALSTATTSIQNVVIGNEAAINSTSGDNNVMIGYQSGYNTESVNNVVAIGNMSGYNNDTDNNVFVGSEAGHENITGANQTLIGFQAGYNVTGDNNTALGSMAAKTLGTGQANVAIGVKSGYSLTSGSKNILIGAATTTSSTDAAGYSLTTGSDNIIVGSDAGDTMTNGSLNVLIGSKAGKSLSAPVGTVAVGYNAGSSQTTQSGDIFIGYQAGKTNNNALGNIIAIGYDAGAGTGADVSTSILIGKEAGKNLKGSYNIAMGYQAMKNQTSGAGVPGGNVFIGHNSGLNITSGSRSVAIGGGNETGSVGVLSSMTTQSDNTAIGYLAGKSAVSAQNTLLGSYTGSSLTFGGVNTMVGYNAGKSTTLGNENVFLGANSGFSTTTGNSNTILGTNAGYLNTAGASQVLVGHEAGYNNTANGVVAIGNQAGRANSIATNNIYIGNQSGAGGSGQLSNLTGELNIMIGNQAGYNAAAAQKNVLIGSQSGYTLTNAKNNVMIGDQSGYRLTTGEQNVFIGANQVGYNSTTATDNVFIGYNSGYNNTTGNRNLFMGSKAAFNSTSSNDNICMGINSGYELTAGGYNIYMGNDAGYHNTGSNNICIGYKAGSTDGLLTTVNFNNAICVGYHAGLLNQSSNLISIGANASANNSTGLANISIGYNAGNANISGSNNIAIGENAGKFSTTNNNIFIGANAASANIIGAENICIGAGSGQNNVSGNDNIYMGYNAGHNATISNFNIGIGYEAGLQNITGNRNLYFGFRAGRNALMSDNVFIGNEAGLFTTTGEQNLFLGSKSGYSTTTGSGNLFMGYRSGYTNTTGNNSMFVGYQSGYNNTTGSNSLFFGAEAGFSNTSSDNNLAIGFRSQTLNTAGEQNLSIGSYSLYGNKLGSNNMVIGSNAVSTGNIGDNNVVFGSDASRIVQNPSFQNNIVAGYASNLQGFASSKSIIIGSNAVDIGAGGENNIVIGQNTAANLGVGKEAINPSAPAFTADDTIYFNNTNYDFIKPGQYMVISYDNNKLYKPQIVYATAATETSATLSAPLTNDLATTDKLYLLYGSTSSIIAEDGAYIYNNYVIVKTPKNYLESVFAVNDKIIIQSINNNVSQTVNIVSFSVFTGSASAGTTKITIDTQLSNYYDENDVIYLARLKSNEIGTQDTSLASANIVMGFDAANSLTMGSKNIAMGDSALRNITTQKYNTAIGSNAGYNVKSDNNLLLGTKAGYNIDAGMTGSGGNTIIGFAAGQFAGTSTTIESSNNLFIGNRVAQINQGSNNIFIGQETETLLSEDSIGKTEYSNKLAIYKSDGGIPTDPLIGGDLSQNLIGIGTIDPKSTLDVDGSFGTVVNTIRQFTTVLDYPVGTTTYLDKTETTIIFENTPGNASVYPTLSNSGTALIGGEFISYTNKYTSPGISGITNITRGIYDTPPQHYPKGTKLFDAGVVLTTDALSTDIPETGIISVNSISDFSFAYGLTAMVVIDSEIVQVTNKGTGLGKVVRGLAESGATAHSTGAKVINMASTVNDLIITNLTNSINSFQTYIPLNPDGFYSSGYLSINSELINYTDNTPYLFNVSRGTNGTTPTSHPIGTGAYLVYDATDDLNTSVLTSAIGTNNDPIVVNNLNSFANTGYIIIDSEIIQYDNIGLLGLTRATNGSSLPSSGFYPIGTAVTLISSGITSLLTTFLDQEIDENGIFDIGGYPVPPNTIILQDASGFPATNGVILIESELITYPTRTNNTLNNCVRGAYGTSAAAHEKSTSVYRLSGSSYPNGLIQQLNTGDTAIRFLSGHQNFTSTGTVVVGSEIITYTQLALNDITRGISGTNAASHSAAATVYNFEELLEQNVTLESGILSTQTNISLSKVGNMTLEGTILIGNELITYSDGIGIINVTRGDEGTTATSHSINTLVYNFPGIIGGYSTLKYDMSALETGIPVNNNIVYSPTGGIVLVDSEIMSYENKFTLDEVTRGAAGSIPSSHTEGTPVRQIVSTDAASPLAARLSSTDKTVVLNDITDFVTPTPLTITAVPNNVFVSMIENEIFGYQTTGNSLVTFSSRGEYGSTAIAHGTTGVSVYEITSSTNLPLGNRIEAADVSVIAETDNSGFTSSGYILVGDEIMYYQDKNKSLEATTRAYRDVSVGATSHPSGTDVYEITYNDNLSVSTIAGLTGNSKFLTTDLAIPVSGNIDNNTNYPASGTILVGTELINYTAKKNSLVLDTLDNRGLYNSTRQSHLSGANVSEITVSASITANIIDNFIGSDFIPLDNTTGFGNSGVVKMERELISYSSKDNTITTDTRDGKLGTSSASHLIGTDVYSIEIIASTTSLQNITNTETNFIIVNNTTDFNDSGEAMIYDNMNDKMEIIQYNSKNNTLINVSRGLDQSVGLTFLANDNFYGIIEHNTNIELLYDISSTQAYLPIISYDGLTALLSESGHLALNNELIEYTQNAQDFNNVSRNPLGYGANSQLSKSAVNKIRDYDEGIPLHNYSSIDASYANYPFKLGDNGQLSRGFNGTIAAEHSSNSTIRIIADNRDDLINKVVIGNPINTTQTTIRVNNLTGITSSTGQLIIDAEIMDYSIPVGSINTINITKRGASNTIASIHSVSAYVYFIPGNLANPNQVIISMIQYSSITNSSTNGIEFIMDNITNNDQLNVPTTGIALIDSELITYRSIKNKIGDFTTNQNIYQNYSFTMERGTNSTSAGGHLANKIIHIKRDTNNLENTTISGDISSSITAIPLTSTTGFTTDLPGYVLIDNEIIQYSGISGLYLTECIREYIFGSSPAASHTNGTTIYRIDEPYVFYMPNISDTITSGTCWLGNMPLNILGSQGTFRYEDEIIKYTNVSTIYTNKLLNCTRNVNVSGKQYPPTSLLSAGTGITGSVTLSTADYSNGEYNISASSIPGSYNYPSLAFNNYDIETTLTTSFSSGDTYIPVSSTTNFPSSGTVIIDNEIISYAGKTSTEFITLTRSSPTSHSSGVSVYNHSYTDAGWHSNSGVYNAGTGAYTGAESTTIDGTPYTGEWIQLEVPSPIVPSGFYINEPTNHSTSVIVAGSYDGTTWKLLNTALPIVPTTGENFISTSTLMYYKYFRYIIRTITPGNTYCSIKQFNIYSNEEFTNYSNVIKIYTESDFINISLDMSANYVLMNDITIVNDWYAFTDPFDGKLSGNGYTITFDSGTTMDGYGIFDNIYDNGIVSNLNIVHNSALQTTFQYPSYGTLGNLNSGTIEYCNVTRTLYSCPSGFGGIIKFNNGTINYCNVNLISSYTEVNNGACGGIALTQNSDYPIYGSSVTGNLKGSYLVGGIVAFLNSGTINQCYSALNIEGNFNQAYGASDSSYGGLVGTISGAVIFSIPTVANIINSYSTGSVNTSSQTIYVGGLIGNIENTGGTINITNCYSTGLVSSTDTNTTSGFIGVINNTYALSPYITISNCFYDTESSGKNSQVSANINSDEDIFTLQTINDNITGKTTAEMKTQSTFTDAGWDFTTIWNITSSYPFLRITNTPAPDFPYPFVETSPKIHPRNTITYQLGEDKNATIIRSSTIKPHTYSDTIISLLDTSSFPASGYCLIDNEFFKYTTSTNNTLQVVSRGLGYSSQSAHKSGKIAYYIPSIPKTLFVNEINKSTTTIEFDEGLIGNQGITGGLFCINDKYATEFIKVDSARGYNKNMNNKNNTYALSYLSGSNYISKEIITVNNQRLNTTPDMTTGTTCDYYLIGNSVIISDELITLKTSTYTIEISPINYTYPSLAISTLTVVSATNLHKFNPSGGYLLLVNYDILNNLNQVLLIKYTSITGSILSGVSIIGTPPNYGSTVSFDYVIYLKNNSYVFDANSETLLNVGQNTISVDKDLIPITSVLLGIPETGVGVNLSLITNKTYYEDVYRCQRNTTPYYGSVSKLTRIDSPETGILKESISNSSLSIPTISSDYFGNQGYLLVDIDYVTFSEGSGVQAITRGALNTTAVTHLAGSSYYQYQLTDPTTLRYNLTTTQQNISITSSNGLTIYDRFLIAGAAGPKNYEIISSDYWINSLDNITRNYLATGATSFPVSNNINVYGLNTIVNSTLRSAINGTTRFIPLNNGSLYPSDFGSLGNYVLIDNELISLNNRNSVDTITRNYLGTSTATTSTQLSYVSNIQTHSTLRQDISQYHLFAPLVNAASYTNTNGIVLIGSEWFNYTNKNSFDFTIPNRAQYNTIIRNYETDDETPVIIVQGITTHGCNLRENITATTNAIPLDNVNTPYSTDSLILIDSEFMKTGTKYTFDMIGLVERQQFNTNLFTTDITGYPIYQVLVSAPSVLRDAIGATTAFIPVVDGSGYSSSGIGLVDSEFFFWSNKNSLDGLVRGLYGSSAANHETTSELNIVSRLAYFDTDITGNVIIDSLTIEGDKVLLSDEVAGIMVSNTLDFTTIPNSGTVLIGSEEIKYNSKDTLADITRGTNGTTITTHANLDRVYLIDNIQNTSLVSRTLTLGIIFSSTDINLNNTSGLPSSGLIIIDSEIIEYDSIDGLTLKDCSRGKLSTIPVSHLTGTKVYIIPDTNIINNRIYQDFTMTTQQTIVSLLSNADFPTEGTILIGSEIMTYGTKQALGNLDRGVNSTTPRGYQDGTPLSLLNITLTVKDSTVIIDTSLSNMTIDLPDSIDVSGRIYSVKKNLATNDIIINPYQSQTIDGSTTYNLTEINAFITFQSDGANWKIISNSNFEPAGSSQTAVAQANAYTDASITALKDDVVPGLDTLNKIAQSIANDTNFYTTMLNLLSAKLSTATAATTYAPLINPQFPQNVYRDINTVSQLTSESTAITIDSAVGVINTYAAVFPTNNTFSFTVNNNTVAVDDIIFTQVITPDTIQTPLVAVRNIANGSFIITMRNITGSSITPAISQKIAFQVVKKI